MNTFNQQEKKRIIIFFRNRLVVGGVETYMYDQAKRLADQGWQIIWVRKHPFARLDAALADVFAADSTIVWNRRVNRKKMEKLVGDGNAEVKIITFNMFQFAQAEKFKKAFRLCPVSTFLFIPHYMGEALFFEENHSGKRCEKVKNRMTQVIQKMHNGGNLRYFNIKHMQIMSANYGYEIQDTNEAFVPPREADGRVFDEERCRRLATRERFNLLTVSRFDFPHKGYVLGLIRTYARLKPSYPQLELTIVGYGREQVRVEQEIAQLDEIARKDVHLVGQVSPSQLNEYYSDANLNVSVAASCSQGARNGTLSLPARHYSYDCEVYGFFPESRTMTVSDKPGYPVADYIEQVLNMSEEQYCRRCREGFLTFNDDYVSVRKSMDQIVNPSQAPTLSDRDIRYITNQELWRELRSKKRGMMRILKKIWGKLPVTVRKDPTK